MSLCWRDSVDAADLFLSVITIPDLMIGILRIERRVAVKGSVLRAWMIGQVLPAFANRILPVDKDVTLRCGNCTAG